ncbi:MAG TPA: DUF167 family protein [Methylocystis sp.]
MGEGGAEKASSAWAIESGGVALYVRLTPKGGRDALDGVEALADGRNVLKARVRAAPENGRANAALIALIAATLKTPKSAVSIRAGATGRVKTVFIAGAPALYLDALAKLAPTHG